MIYILFFRILTSIVILGKACDLIDCHQQNKKITGSKSTKKEECSTTTSSSNVTAVVSTKHVNETTGKPSLKPGRSKDVQGLPLANEVADNSLDISSVPFSPITPRTIEATNKDLRLSSIVLENKIQTLFGKPVSSNVQHENKYLEVSDKIGFENSSYPRDDALYSENKISIGFKNVASHLPCRTTTISESSLTQTANSSGRITGITIET